MRKHRRRNRRKIIIFSIVGLIFCLSIGYAAFSSSFLINGKGIIVEGQPDSCFETKENSDGTLSITSYDEEKCGTEVVIPSYINHKKVTKIANGAGWPNNFTSKGIGTFANRNITSVTFPDTLEEVGDFAFYNNKLTTLKLPNSVKTVGMESFKNNQISFIEYSDSLTNIKSLAFSNNSLTSVAVPNTVKFLGVGAYAKNKVTKGDVYIFDRNLDGTDNTLILNSYVGDGTYLPDMPHVTEIGPYAFRDCYINTLSLPNGVTKINDGAFGWAIVKSLTIPASITAIHSSAFSYATITINIDRKENAISGSPWGATNETINWTVIN